MAEVRDDDGAVGALAEPLRRALYELVARGPEPVSREQAARALDVPVHTVKFHLDKLAAAGLLEVEFRRLSGRSGPGAGRPAKLYRRSAREVSFSVPPRHYDLAAEVMAEAIDRAGRESAAVGDVLPEVARAAGRALARTADVRRATAEIQRVHDVLAGAGYEPHVDDDGVLRLHNCPFDRLADRYTALVCGMNLELVAGVVDGVEARDASPALEPQPGYCCVTVRPAATPS